MNPSAVAEFLRLRPRFISPLDPYFYPLSLFQRTYARALENEGGGVPVKIGLERENGLFSVFATRVLPPSAKTKDLTRFWVERLVKFFLWSRGGWKVVWQGPPEPGARLRDAYSPQGERAFDAKLMSRVYQKDFVVEFMAPGPFPDERETPSALGGNWDGCRIGFDLGASDLKVASVVDGQAVFTREIPWQPQVQADPSFHCSRIQDGLKMAASHMPRLEAIGGSAAGIYIANQVRVASLFRSVPEVVFEQRVKDLFLQLGREWNVPLVVLNDGEVTALAGALSLNRAPMLGVAMGSSQAAGFVDGQGRLRGWLDELAFAPLDASSSAPRDEWSGDQGVGASYFSQQAVDRLAGAAGFSFPDEAGLPERLKEIQRLADGDDPRALEVFRTIGLYLGYALPLYGLFYDLQNCLLLGRVTSGAAGAVIRDKAVEVLRVEFPEWADRLALHLLDEHSRRLGQAVAAASLPRIVRKEDSPS